MHKNKRAFLWLFISFLASPVHALSPARVEAQLKVEFVEQGVALQENERARILEIGSKAMTWCTRQPSYIVGHAVASEGPAAHRAHLASARARYLAELLRAVGIRGGEIKISSDPEPVRATPSEKKDDPKPAPYATLALAGVPNFRFCPEDDSGFPTGLR